MSLDVSLIKKDKASEQVSFEIFIREKGQTEFIPQQEWNSRHPHSQVIRTDSICHDDDEVFWANITHNLSEMASEAGIYQYLWEPRKLEIKTAKELIEPLKEGLLKLKSKPEFFKQFTPKNGWGSYDKLVEFVGNYLNACEENPDAEVSANA